MLTIEQWAAWVQAVGSIAAVLGAFWLSRLQFRDASRLQRVAHAAERRRRYEAIVGFLEGAIPEYHKALSALSGEDPETHFRENSTLDLMSEFHKALQQVSPLDMPSRDSARALVKLRDLLGTAVFNASAPFARRGSLVGEYATCASALRDNLKEIEELRRVLEGALAAPIAL